MKFRHHVKDGTPWIAQAQQAGDPGKLLHETPIVKPKNLITASQTLLTGSITSMGLCENTTALPLLLLL